MCINCSLMQQLHQHLVPVFWCGCSGAATSICCLVPLVCHHRSTSHAARPQPLSQSPTLIGEQPPISNFIPGSSFLQRCLSALFAHLFTANLSPLNPCYSVVFDFALKGQAFKTNVHILSLIKGTVYQLLIAKLVYILGWTRPLPEQQQVHTQCFAQFSMTLQLGILMC
jgi:hypothetical protein